MPASVLDVSASPFSSDRRTSHGISLLSTSLVLSKSFRYFKVDPGPSDITLAIEIAGASLAFDLGEKAEACGQGGIPEYWVADVNTMTLTVHRRPNRVSGYDEVRNLSHDEEVFPLALQVLSFPVSAAFLHLR